MEFTNSNGVFSEALQKSAPAFAKTNKQKAYFVKGALESACPVTVTKPDAYNSFLHTTYAQNLMEDGHNLHSICFSRSTAVTAVILHCLADVTFRVTVLDYVACHKGLETRNTCSYFDLCLKQKPFIHSEVNVSHAGKFHFETAFAVTEDVASLILCANRSLKSTELTTRLCCKNLTFIE